MRTMLRRSIKPEWLVCGPPGGVKLGAQPMGGGGGGLHVGLSLQGGKEELLVAWNCVPISSPWLWGNLFFFFLFVPPKKSDVSNFEQGDFS